MLHGYEQKAIGIAGLEFFKKGKLRLIDKNLYNRVVFIDKNVLDIGFGRGEAIKYAKEKGAKNVIGVDFSKDAYDIATEFLNKYNIEAKLYCEDILIFIKEYIKNIDISFNIISMLDVIEHIPRDEMCEILTLLPKISIGNFVILINTPFFEVDNDVIKEGLKEEAKDSSDKYEETIGMHCNRYTKLSLVKFMNNYGYKELDNNVFYYVNKMV